MRITAIAATLAGLALFVGLMIRESAGIAAAIAAAGWSLVWVALFHLASLSLDALAWLSLTRPPRPAFVSFLWARWIAESFNSLLPVAQVGGHFMRAVLIAGSRLSTSRASATVMVDFTIGLATQLLLGIIGMLLLLGLLGEATGMAGLASLAIGLVLLAGFILAQMKGVFSLLIAFTRRHISRHRKVMELGGSARNLDDQIAHIYGNGRNLLACAFLRTGGWLAKAAETMLTLYLLGHPVPFRDAFIIESLSNVLASAVFVIPGGLGVREGGVLLLGSLLGLPPDTALALALVRRGREVLLGMPGCLQWLVTRGPRLIRRQENASNGEDGSHK